MKSITTIPGIRSVFWLNTYMLPPQISSKCSVGISIYVPETLSEIHIGPDANVEIVDDYKNNGRTVKTTLTFKSDCELESLSQLAFIYTDAIGRHFLIGTREKPFPIINIKKTTGVPGSSSSVIEYTITWLSQCRPPECHIIEV